MPAFDPARGGDQFERPLDRAVGGKTAKALEKAFEMRTVRDLLWHFPRRYSNRGDLTPLKGLPVGEHVTVLAQVIDVRERTMQRRRGKLLEVRITDGKGFLSLTFFNQPWRAKLLLPGKQGIFSGKVSEYRGIMQLQHPNYQLFEDQAERAQDHLDAPVVADGEGAAIEPTAEKAQELQEAAARAWAERPIPIYPATSTMPSWNIELAVETALHSLGPIEDPLPREIRASEGVFALDPALRLIHRPERTVDWQKARDSMRFREAFELQLALLDQKRRAGIEASTPRPARESGLLDLFDSSLPFELTRGQRDVGETISNELSEPHPMHRLLQGEVGSGKTIVALRAMVQVAESGSSLSDAVLGGPDAADPKVGAAVPDGGQSAMLAPTEVLAAQHFRSITESLGEELTEKLSPVLITSKMPVAARRKSLLAIASGVAKVAVGTHALLSDQVTFFDLGLIVVDEQHRFGVEQRETLRRKGVQPHVLTMTATPIPRTVALTAFGDLEVSTIRDLPPGRQGIETHVVPELEIPQREARVWSRAREDIAAGRQVYVVCPAISATTREAGDEEVQGAPTDPEATKRPIVSVEATVEELRARPEFVGVRVEPLTGAMKQDEKDAAMRSFVAGETAILVATTVIEVGVNVPNASMMIVRDADRFGISQLHQLRGRVGRGEHPGLCLLVTTAPEGSPARERIEAVAQTSDGFALADVDLELRREGDILGTAQSGGRSTLRLLRVTEHGVLIEHARDVAADLLERDPDLDSAPLLRDLFAREREAAHLENLAKS